MTSFQAYCHSMYSDNPLPWEIQPAGFFFDDIQDVQEFVNRYIHVPAGRDKITIHADGTVDVDGNCWINPCFHIARSIPIRLGHIKGDCYFHRDGLIDNLSGSPRRIDGNFRVEGVRVSSLVGAPDYVQGCFSIASSDLETLQGASGQYGCLDISSTNIKVWPDFILRTKRLSVGSWQLEENPSLAQFRELALRGYLSGKAAWKEVICLSNAGKVLEAAEKFSLLYPGESLLVSQPASLETIPDLSEIAP